MSDPQRGSGGARQAFLVAAVMMAIAVVGMARGLTDAIQPTDGLPAIVREVGVKLGATNVLASLVLAIGATLVSARRRSATWLATQAIYVNVVWSLAEGAAFGWAYANLANNQPWLAVAVTVAQSAIKVVMYIWLRQRLHRPDVQEFLEAS